MADEKNEYRIVAQTEGDGFFGLTMFEMFTRQIDCHIEAHKDCPVILDFSFVKLWDISVLLWMTIALEYYKRQGLCFILKLPQGNSEMTTKERFRFDKSADYLRRWRFDQALSCIDSNIENLLIDNQKDYFDPPEPRKYYRPKMVRTNEGLVDSLISRRLAEIKLLSDKDITGIGTIKPETIAKRIGEYQDEHIGGILTTTCQMDKDKAELFSNHLINEGLHNVKEHPNASIGLIAISPMGNSGLLILCIADNGDSIADTIYSRFLADVDDTSNLPEKYSCNGIDNNLKSQIIHHATKKGVTSKAKFMSSKETGMGLTYIKEDTVNLYNGNLRIITDGLFQEYEGSSEEPSEWKAWNGPWSGNLLRIQIPIKFDPYKKANNQKTGNTI